MLGASVGLSTEDTDAALVALENEGAILRGSFTGASQEVEWCDRRLLARIHRYTLNRLRAEIEPVSPSDFMRFLFAWQHVDATTMLIGIEGLRSVVAMLDGFELAAGAWERAVLPARVSGYDPSMLDMLCLTGEVGWARLSTPMLSDGSGVTQLGGTTPIALFLREHGAMWQTLRRTREPEDGTAPVPDALSEPSRHVLAALRSRGASFARELGAACGNDEATVAAALGELVAAGIVASDGFTGVRAMTRSPGGRVPAQDSRAQAAGRWFLLGGDEASAARESAVETQVWSLLRRYGVLFRRLLTRESTAAPWRELTRVCRRLEARGEIRGGRFVSGMSGEQFALPDAVVSLREIRRTQRDGRLIAVCGADPLNLTGIITSGERVRAVSGSRIVYRDGVPLAAIEGDYMRTLTPDATPSAEVASALTGRRMPAVASGFVGR
jgi:ATP-dependent Lhr-like helicase